MRYAQSVDKFDSHFRLVSENFLVLDVDEFDPYTADACQSVVVGLSKQVDYLLDALCDWQSGNVVLGNFDQTYGSMFFPSFHRLLVAANAQQPLIDENEFDPYTAGAMSVYCQPLVKSIAQLTLFFWSGSVDYLSGLKIGCTISPDTYDPYIVSAIETAFDPISEQFAEVALTTVESAFESRFGTSWNNVILDDLTLQQLRSIEAGLLRSESLKRAGFSVPRSLLLHGPPGTGKTEIAKAIATSSDRSFLSVTTADFKAKYLGQSGHAVKDIFDEAREDGPTILFIDELDSVASERGGSDTFNDEIIGQLLAEMEGVDATPEIVYVVGATNNLEQIDPAVRQRFATTIEVNAPSYDQRIRLIRLLLGTKAIDKSPAFASYRLAEISAETVLTGRDYRNAIEKAEQRATFRAVESDDFDAHLVLKLDDLVEIISEEGKRALAQFG
jgi:ATP-dependent 26S proteasome regulatory subunit